MAVNVLMGGQVLGEKLQATLHVHKE